MSQRLNAGIRTIALILISSAIGAGIFYGVGAISGDDVYDREDMAEFWDNQENYVAPAPQIADFYSDPSDGNAILDGLSQHLSDSDEYDSIEQWRPIEEIAWSIKGAGAYLGKDYIESAMNYDGGFEIDLPMRFVDNPDAEDVNVVFIIGEVSERCELPGSSAGCVNRLGAIYDNLGSCEVILQDEDEIDLESMTYSTLSPWARVNVHMIEVVLHELGHCMGLTHKLDGVMSSVLWEPDKITTPSKLEREVVQGIIYELRRRVAEQKLVDYLRGVLQLVRGL